MTAAKITAINARILANMQTGMTLPEAFDAVLGQGAYVKLAGSVYDALRAPGRPAFLRTCPGCKTVLGHGHAVGCSA